MTEISAIKIEIAAAIYRRMKMDGRASSDLFGVAQAALSESLADLIFAAAKDRPHGERLLSISKTIIESRWRQLAVDHKPEAA